MNVSSREQTSGTTSPSIITRPPSYKSGGADGASGSSPPSTHPSGLAAFDRAALVEPLIPSVKSDRPSNVSSNSLVFKYVTASFFACDPFVSKSRSNLSKFSLLVGWTMMMSKNPSEGEASGADFVSPLPQGRFIAHMPRIFSSLIVLNSPSLRPRSDFPSRSQTDLVSCETLYVKSILYVLRLMSLAIAWTMKRVPPKQRKRSDSKSTSAKKPHDTLSKAVF